MELAGWPGWHTVAAQGHRADGPAPERAAQARRMLCWRSLRSWMPTLRCPLISLSGAAAPGWPARAGKPPRAVAARVSDTFSAGEGGPLPGDSALLESEPVAEAGVSGRGGLRQGRARRGGALLCSLPVPQPVRSLPLHPKQRMQAAPQGFLLHPQLDGAVRAGGAGRQPRLGGRGRALDACGERARPLNVHNKLPLVVPAWAVPAGAARLERAGLVPRRLHLSLWESAP